MAGNRLFFLFSARKFIYQEMCHSNINPLINTYFFSYLATADFLLKNGQSASWIIGTKIVTVTTSTCDQVSNRGPLCDRCYLVCSRNKPDEGGRHKSSEGISSQCGSMQDRSGSIQDPDDSSRRRHMSDQVGSPSKQLPPLLMRRGSIEKVNNKRSNEDLTNLENLLENQKEEDRKAPELCACWCNGWAEIHVRRPSGDVSWMTRVQNSTLTSEAHTDFPLKGSDDDFTNFFIARFELHSALWK